MDPSMPDSPRTTKSTRLFVVGAVILLALNAFLSSLRTKPTVRDTSYLIGTVVGAGLVFTLIGLVVYGVARAFRKAKTGAAAARLAFWTMAVLFVVNCATLVGQVPPVSQASTDTIVTDAERRGLQLDAETIRHTMFGFVLPRPGVGFAVNPQLQRQLDEAFAETPDMVGWALSDTIQRRGLLTIQVTKMPRVDETVFRKFTHGIQEGFTKSKVVDESLSWKPGASEYRLTMQHPSGFYAAMRCIPRVETGRSLIVCVTITASQPDAFESSRNGLKLIQ